VASLVTMPWKCSIHRLAGEYSVISRAFRPIRMSNSCIHLRKLYWKEIFDWKIQTVKCYDIIWMQWNDIIYCIIDSTYGIRDITLTYLTEMARTQARFIPSNRETLRTIRHLSFVLCPVNLSPLKSTSDLQKTESTRKLT